MTEDDVTREDQDDGSTLDGTANPGDEAPREDEKAAPAGARILVTDDEESMRYYLKRSLKRRGYRVEAAEDGEKALELEEARPFDVVVLDLKMPGMDGLEVLRRVRKLDPEVMVILMTAYGTIRSAVEAMRNGAFDYITKPFEIEELEILVERALEQRAFLRQNRTLRQIVDNRRAYGGLIGQSPAMRKVFQTIDQLRSSPATVLISGESGTGKELLARALHIHSELGDGPFVAVNGSALPDTLFESELFGYEPGAFTGALKRKRGFIEQADGGTLFLDEISEISLQAQAKLLRFLQERTFTLLGGTEPVTVDLRVIAATNRDLAHHVEKGAFRQDLFWRLNVVPVTLPPLRERREDIPILASHFLERYRAQAEAAVKGFSVDALLLLTHYDWPGNVRELENTVERMVVLNAHETELDATHVPPTIRDRTQVPKPPRPEGEVPPFPEALSAFEKEYLYGLLERTAGNISQAARQSGISRSTLHQKIKQHDLDPDRFRG